MSNSEKGSHLRMAQAFFGADRPLAEITVEDVEAWLEKLRRRPGRGGNEGLAGQTLRHYLNDLS